MTIQDMLESMDYKNVLRYFTELSAIPRGSGNNEGISNYLVAFAKQHGLRYVQDEALNIIIYKEATKGYEDHTPVILQGHMDMVCVKEPGSKHNFEQDGLELFVDGEYLAAKGTTLGGDDGIAMAYGMALLADNTLQHPALEIVITTDEETGMDGAVALNPELLQGRMMINADSEDEEVVLVSSAGGLRVIGSLLLKRREFEGRLVTIQIAGLKGGHSGAEIHSNRTNAVLLMARLLLELKDQLEVSLISLTGGEKENAIPSDCIAELAVSDSKAAEELKKEVNARTAIYQKELSSAEPGLSITVTKKEALPNVKVEVLHPTSFEKLLFLLIQAPNGVQAMSADMKGLVETSLNLGIFEMKSEEALYHYSVRSSLDSAKWFLSRKLSYLFELLGGRCETGADYPAWEYRKESPLREKFAQVYTKYYGKPPIFSSIHAGLECGLIAEKIPEMDIVSIGPEMHEIHSPRERLGIKSSIRVYKFLEKLLEAMEH